MGSKKENTATVQESAPVAAPALAPEPQAPEETQSPVDVQPETPEVVQPQAPEPQAPEENTEDPEAEHPHAEKIAKCKDALKAFPSLPEGYVCAKGIYFVREMAEAALAKGEELIIVTLEK